MLASQHLPEGFNAAEWFVGRHLREGRGERVAIVSDEGSATYAQLDFSVRRFAAVLSGAGVRHGDRVAVLLPDSITLSVAFWGSIAAGAVAVPVNPLLNPQEHRKIVDDCDPRLVVVDAARSPIAGDDGIAAATREIWTAEDVRDRISAGAPAPSYAPTRRDDPAFFL
jgi:4-hydroxybenzoate-CoA ligase